MFTFLFLPCRRRYAAQMRAFGIAKNVIGEDLVAARGEMSSLAVDYLPELARPICLLQYKRVLEYLSRYGIR